MNAPTAAPGVILILNDQEVMLAPKDTDAPDKSKPRTFQLDHRVDLGTLTDLKNFVESNFGGTWPDLTKLPTPLDQIASKIMNLGFSVENFTLTVPATTDSGGQPLQPAQQKSCSFDVGMSATWADPIPVVGSLKIKGLYVHVSKDDAP